MEKKMDFVLSRSPHVRRQATRWRAFRLTAFSVLALVSVSVGVAHHPVTAEANESLSAPIAIRAVAQWKPALDIESSLHIAYPTAIAWSPDGRTLAYQMTNQYGSDIKLYDFERRSSAMLVTGIPPYAYSGERPDLRWTPDGSHVIYRANNDYFTVRPGSPPEMLVSGLLGRFLNLSPDQASVSFVRDGDLWVMSLKDRTPRPLTQGYVASFSALTQWPQWSPDSSRITYLSSMERGVKVAVVTVAGGKAVTIAPREDIFTFTSVDWSPDSRQIAISRMSQDYRRKELVVASADGQPVREVWQDADDKWVNHEVAASYDVAWASDSSRFAFLSNHDGWTHLYLADLNRGAPVQLTKGESTEFWCSWAPGDRSILTISSRGHLQQRLLWMVPTSGGELQQLIPDTGITFPTLANHAEPVWSSDGRRLAYVFSGPDEPPGLWTVDVSGGSPVRIESGLPSGNDAAAVAHIEAVEFKSVADGARVPGVLITSKNLRRNVRNPALIFTYGGYLQMATLGWGLGAKSRLFNYLAHKGYVVLIVDPRGSEGYGDWYAKELYKGAGGKQVDDLVAGARYLANLSYVDPKGIGIFGHSYSGYLAFQTLVQAPPDTFAAGIILAGFFDWMREEGFGTRYQVYTRIRVGTDDETPNLLYERSPANFLEKLKAPVLLVHGTRDTNVPIVETEYLVRRMLKADKEFDYMVYPGEPHGLVQPESERDFCRRVERYLDRHLRHQEKTPSP